MSNTKSYPETARGAVRRAEWGDGRRNCTWDEEDEDSIY
jgi:hypothetical protein